MKHTSDDIYKKVKDLSKNVTDHLRRQGVIVPTKTEDGLIRVGHFKIKKSKTGFYSILNYRNDTVIDFINLPQTAALLANKLALGKFIDDNLLAADRSYGHALFEEELHKAMAERSVKLNNIDKAEIMYTKFNTAKYKREKHKKLIILSFDKLLKFR